MLCPCRYTPVLTLPLLTLIYTIGELAHYLIGVVSRQMAQNLEFGDKSCLPTTPTDSWHQCANFTTENTCNASTSGSGTHPCEWNYNGLGYDYQLLAGAYFMIIYTTSAILWGILADRFNRVNLLAIATLCGGLAISGTAFATRYSHVVVSRMATAATTSSVSPIAASLLTDTYPASTQALVMGTFNTGIYVGFGSSFLFGYVSSWRNAFFYTGISATLTSLLLCLTVRDTSHRSQEPDTTSLVEVPSKSPPVSLVVTLLVAACIRHSAGYIWAYNSALYFQTYYPEYDVNVYQTVISIVSGVIGVIGGGALSDKLVINHGPKSRTLVLAASQFISTPISVAIFYLAPPYPFIALFIASLFSEMWFGMLYVELVDLAPPKYKTTGVAIALFVINNVGGSLPVIVEPLSAITSYRTALLILYPGALFTSSLLFFACHIMINRNS